MIEKIEEYCENVVCYTLNGRGYSEKNTSLAITKANELCELDGGKELLRTRSKKLPENFKLHGNNLDFNIIYATPNTKHLAKEASKKYKADIIMIY